MDISTNEFEGMNDIQGLQFIPVNNLKQPMVKEWQTKVCKYDLSKCPAVGLVCGEPSGGVEVIDIDCKYDISGNMYDRFKRLVHSMDNQLLAKLVVQKTRSGGYHLIYRCEKIEGNLKLANRPTTDQEKKQTYEKTYTGQIQNSKDASEAHRNALKSSENDRVRVLFETRGIGGQIVIFPSKGYEFIHGDFYSIEKITIHEREILLDAARQFNEVFEQVDIPRKDKVKIKGLSPFDDFNERGDVIALLEKHGWTVVNQRGKKTHLLRPGHTTAQTSGNFDHEKNWFSVFTTSTEFEPCHAYLPYSVFCVLECNKDYSEAAKRLLEMGFGEKDIQKKQDKPSTRVIQSRVDVNDNNYSFLATPPDYEPYLESVRNGTLQMGKTTGFPSLDEHFLWKEGSLIMINGLDNVGKSAFMWYLQLVSSMYHGYKWIIFSSENTLGNFMRKCIQFYWGKQLYGKYAMTDTEYQTAKIFVENHFKLIKAQEDLFNYKDIINMVKKARVKYPDIKWGMIDPYNSLKIDLSGFSKLNTHEYHYEALSEIKAYGQQTGFGWVLNNHAVTSAIRLKDNDKKYSVAPRKEDTEGGGKFANKADDFLTIHRVTNHPSDWMITEVHVRKIKDTETGGRPTSIETPVKFEMYKGMTAFLERLYEGGKCIDPVYEWHVKNNPNFTDSQFPTQKQFSPVIDMWKPFKDDNNDIEF